VAARGELMLLSFERPTGSRPRARVRPSAAQALSAVLENCTESHIEAAPRQRRCSSYGYHRTGPDPV